MKPSIALLFAVFAVSGMAAANAAPPASASSAAVVTDAFAAVRDLQASVAHDEARMEWNLFQASLNEWPKDTNVEKEALDALDAKLDAALAQAKADPQVLTATKALYVAAQDYFTNIRYGANANNARLKSKLDDALNALKLELKLAQP